MKKFFAVCVKLFVVMSCLCICGVAFAASKQSGNNLDSMSEKDWKALNIFFSNFSETNFEDFSAEDYDDEALIEFAVHHNVINNRKLFKSDPEGGFSIEAKNVAASVKKYFGIEKFTAQDGGNFVSYRDGKYYWDDVLEGSPWFAGSQAVELRDNGDGTLSAVLEDYSDNDHYQKDPDNKSIALFYTPKKAWNASTAKFFDQAGYHAAKIAPYTYDGKKTYKLLEWKAAETLDEALELAWGSK